MTDDTEREMIVASKVLRGDILTPLPDERTQHIMRQLNDLQTWLALQGGKADQGLGTALNIVGEVKAHIACPNAHLPAQGDE